MVATRASKISRQRDWVTLEWLVVRLCVLADDGWNSARSLTRMNLRTYLLLCGSTHCSGTSGDIMYREDRVWGRRLTTLWLLTRVGNLPLGECANRISRKKEMLYEYTRIDWVGGER